MQRRNPDINIPTIKSYLEIVYMHIHRENNAKYELSNQTPIFPMCVVGIVFIVESGKTHLRYSIYASRNFDAVYFIFIHSYFVPRWVWRCYLQNNLDILKPIAHSNEMRFQLINLKRENGWMMKYCRANLQRRNKKYIVLY